MSVSWHLSGINKEEGLSALFEKKADLAKTLLESVSLTEEELYSSMPLKRFGIPEYLAKRALKQINVAKKQLADAAAHPTP